MFKYFKKFLMVLGCLGICLSSFILVVSAAKTDVKGPNYIETNYITMETLTDSFDISVETTKEIEDLIEGAAYKTLGEVQSIDINHNAREVNINYCVDSQLGDGETLVNTSLYNFIKFLNGFCYYDFNFDIYIKAMDKNYRVSKTKFGSYTFNRETLSNLDFTNISSENFISNSDKYWVNSIGEQVTPVDNQVDELQLKIINILKSYLQFKLSETK